MFSHACVIPSTGGRSALRRGDLPSEGCLHPGRTDPLGSGGLHPRGQPSPGGREPVTTVLVLDCK